MQIAESLEGSPVAVEIKNDLHKLALDAGEIYALRSDAAWSLSSLYSDNARADLIENLSRLGDEDSTRLALDLMARTEMAGISPGLFVGVLFADAGIERGTAADVDRCDTHVRMLKRFVARVANAEIEPVLDLITERLAGVPHDGAFGFAKELQDLVFGLIARAISENNEQDGSRIGPWLRWFWVRHHPYERGSPELDRLLKEKVELRQSILHFALIDDDLCQDGPWMRVMAINDVQPALYPTEADLLKLLTHVVERGDRSDRAVAIWKELVAMARQEKGLPQHVRAIASKFVEGNAGLAKHLADWSKPIGRSYERKRSRKQRKSAQKERKVKAVRSEHLRRRAADVVAGDWRVLDLPSEVYVGRFVGATDEPVMRLRETYEEDVVELILRGFEAVLRSNDIPKLTRLSVAHAKGTHYSSHKVLMCGLSERLRIGRSLEEIDRTVLAKGLIGVDVFLLDEDRRGLPPLREPLEAALFADARSFNEFQSLRFLPFFKRPNRRPHGLYSFAEGTSFRQERLNLLQNWLAHFDDLELEWQRLAVITLLKAGRGEEIKTIAAQKRSAVYPNRNTLLYWLSLEVALGDTDVPERFLQDDSYRIFTLGKFEATLISEERLAALISTGRNVWPRCFPPRGSSSGRHNAWDASKIIDGWIEALAGRPTDAAGVVLQDLKRAPADSYSEYLHHKSAEHSQLLVETVYEPISIEALAAAVDQTAPRTPDDLRAVVLDGLKETETYIRGSDTTPLDAYWEGEVPRDENTCRDRFIDHFRAQHAGKLVEIPERLATHSKRADISFLSNGLELPCEAKGQWHKDLWTAPRNQLDKQYTSLPNAHERGIYLVFWFGQSVPKGKRISPHPEGLPTPTLASELQCLLQANLTPAERARLDVVVIDLSVQR